MFKKYYTGIDGQIKLSLSSNFEISYSDSKNKIYVIPSDKMIYLTEKTDLTNKKEILNAYKLKIEEKFPDCYFDIDTENGTVHIIVARDFPKPKEYYMLDGEIFSLARFFNHFTGNDGYVLNIVENRATFVTVKDGKVEFYRVIKSVEIETIINQIEVNSKEKPLLLAGNVTSQIKDRLTEKGFSSIVLPQVCSPQEVSAYGAALKGVLGDRFLSFRKEGIGEEDLKLFSITAAALILIYGLVFVAVDFYQKKLIKDIKRQQVQVFKKAFPDQPVVSAYEQMKSMVKVSPEFKLSEKLLKVEIPKNAKIYKVEYIDGVLTVKGEAAEPPPVAKSVKRTPLGNFEFEVEIK